MSKIVFQIAGYKNTGKTTLICRLIQQFTRKGYRVGTIKHDAHSFDLDVRDKDTWQHREAGAQVVSITSEHRTVFMEERHTPLNQLLVRMDSVDIVLVEGFKDEEYPKLVMVRTEEDLELVERLKNITAVVAWSLEMLNELSIPVFHIDDVETIGNLLLNSVVGENKK